MLNIKQEDFDKEIVQYLGVAVVDYFSTTCAPCRKLAPILANIQTKNPNLKIAKINVAENMDLAYEQKIQVLPTLIFYKDGKAVKMLEGLKSEQEIQKQIDDI